MVDSRPSPGASAAPSTAPTVPPKGDATVALPEGQEPSPESLLAAIVDEAVRTALSMRGYGGPYTGMLVADVGLEVHIRMLEAHLVARYDWQAVPTAKGLRKIADQMEASARQRLDKGEAVFDSPAGAGDAVEADRG